MKFAVLILNRNTKKVVDNLIASFLNNGFGSEDIFVVDAGSRESEIPSRLMIRADDAYTLKHGLRFNRGFNLGLKTLLDNGLFFNYDGFVLAPNDVILGRDFAPSRLETIFARHHRLGLLSPCHHDWGERHFIAKNSLKYFWFIQTHAYVVRRSMIESTWNPEASAFDDFWLDGTNFRGFLGETEIIAKGYANDWASAITTEIFVGENELILSAFYEYIDTEKPEFNDDLYVNEGLAWVRRKYGFSSRWRMNDYAKSMYENFFRYNTELGAWRL